MLENLVVVDFASLFLWWTLALLFRLHQRAARIIINYIINRDVDKDVKQLDLSEEYSNNSQYCKSQHANLWFRHQIEND